MIMKVTVSAPGKINLMGEHAIVYGKPALLSAINLRTYVTVEDKKQIEQTGEYVRHITEIVKKEMKMNMLPALRITIRSEIPVGYHLGSSAAVAVATVGALIYSFTKKWNLDQINNIAYEAEKKMHGNPSGGDNTTITYGGFLWFRKELELLKIKVQLPITLSQKLNHFFLINTGKSKESTGEMVAQVSAKRKVQSVKFKRIFSENENQTKRLTKAIVDENETDLIDAIQKGERTLEDMGVVSRRIIPLMRKIESNRGAVKILGGGGKKDGVGFLLCYHHNPKRVAQLCKPFRYSIQSIALGEDGVRLEKSNSRIYSAP